MANDKNADASKDGYEAKFDRGHQLSIFVRDRNEDLTALLLAFLIAMSSLMIYG